jgi:hypothetical protein
MHIQAQFVLASRTITQVTPKRGTDAKSLEPIVVIV